MIEVTGDIWEIWKELPHTFLCITTNGIVKSNGEAVMGAGMAKQACEHFGDYLTHLLGVKLRKKGNHVHVILEHGEPFLVSFPTKHDWKNMSDLLLITRSCFELMALLDEHPGTQAIITRPGCGFGSLKWDNVKRTIAPILDNRVWVVSK